MTPARPGATASAELPASASSEGTRPVHLAVDRSAPGQRLDSWLRSRFPMVSRGAFQRLIESGNVRVDGRVVKSTHSPRAGEQVALEWPEAKPALAQPEDIPLEILFEDESLLVLNKPPGLVVHPAGGNEEHTLVNALLHHCGGQLSGIGGVARPGIVHRLDKDTSGCLVVAKNDATHLALSAQFAGRTIEKLYLAILCGELQREEGEIHAAIARHSSHRKSMAVDEEHGREALTIYRVIQRLRGSTLVEVELHTGRTHQIRVHFQYLGYPLVGDLTYGKRQNQRLKEEMGHAASRQMLHAYRLSFVHPRSKRKMRFEAPKPADFLGTIEALKVTRD